MRVLLLAHTFKPIKFCEEIHNNTKKYLEH